MSILDTTDVIALAEEKAADLTDEPWTAEAEEYLTRVNGKVYSFPLCIEGRGLIYNKKVCLLYTSPSPRDKRQSRMPSSA